MTAPPPKFPRMTLPCEAVSGLSWYDLGEAGHGLSAMHYNARDGVVPLVYSHPSASHLIGVPRTLAPMGPDTNDLRSIGEFTFNAEFTTELRPEQVPFVEGVFQMMEDELGGIGEAPTGFGKTVTGAALICRIGRPTCVVVPKGDLDWEPEILRHTTIPKEKISHWRGQRLPNPDAWVVVASLQSIYREGVYPAEVYKRFGAVIFDEVHRLGAPEFSAAMRKFPGMWRLGLSATADRRDGKMDLIHAHIGWRHVVGHTDAEQPDYYLVQTDWSEPFIGGKRQHYDPKRTNVAKKHLMADPMRNAAIAGAMYRAHKAGRRTIVFVDQLAHGERLKAAALNMGVPPDALIEYNGQTPAEARAAAKACKSGLLLIATYKFTAEGTNIPALDTAIIAHPIYDPRQAVGRILRKVPGKPKPVVLDIWDTSSPVLHRLAKKRWSYLQKQGATWKGVFG